MSHKAINVITGLFLLIALCMVVSAGNTSLVSEEQSISEANMSLANDGKVISIDGKITDVDGKVTRLYDEKVKNPYSSYTINETQAVNVTDPNNIQLTKKDNNNHTSYVNITGSTMTAHFGRLAVTTTPIVDTGGFEVMGKDYFTHTVDIESAIPEIEGKNTVKKTTDDVNTDYSFYSGLIKENITLNKPVNAVSYDYDIALEDWTIKDLNGTITTNYANESTTNISLDKFGNINITINDAETVIIPKPFAIDANNKRYELSWELDDTNKKMNIIGIENFTDAVYPVKIDPNLIATNPGFETGDLTGWTETWSSRDASEVTSSISHSGTYSYAGASLSGYIVIYRPITYDSVSWLSSYTFFTSYHGGRTITCDGVNTDGRVYDTSTFSWLNSHPGNNDAGVGNVYIYIYGTTAFVDDIVVNQDSPDMWSTPSATTIGAGATLTETWTSYGDGYNFHINWGDGSSTYTTTTKSVIKSGSTTHVYSSAGTYTLFSTIVNSYGRSSVNNTITVIAKPVASFSASPTTVTAPAHIVFTDASSNSPTSWQWYFGPSMGNQTSQNADQIYITPGTYSPILTATNAAGSGGLQRTNYITVNAPSIASGAAPANGATISNSQYTGTVPVTFTWTAWSSCNDYAIVIDGTMSFLGSSTPSFTENLAPGSHTWLVYGWKDGYWGTQSNTNTFTVANYLHAPVPTVVSPVNATPAFVPVAGPMNIDFSWNAFGGYASPVYQYTIYNSAGTVLKQDTTASTSTSYMLASGNNYRWTVAIADPTYGGYGTASTYQTFNITRPAYNGSVYGYVWNQAYNNQSVVPYATVKFMDVALVSTVSNITTTDANGAYMVPLVEMYGNRSYALVEASATGFQTSSSYMPFTLNSTTPGFELNIPLQPIQTYYVTPSFIVRVQTYTGTGIEGVPISVYQSTTTSQSPTATGVTDSGGYITFTYTAGKPYTIWAYDVNKSINKIATLNPSPQNEVCVINTDYDDGGQSVDAPPTSPVQSDYINYMPYTTSYNVTYSYINATIISLDNSTMQYETTIYQTNSTNLSGLYTLVYSTSGASNRTTVSKLVPKGNTYVITTNITHPTIGYKIPYKWTFDIKATDVTLDLGFEDTWNYNLLAILLMLVVGGLFGAMNSGAGAISVMLVGGFNLWAGWIHLDTGSMIMMFMGCLLVVAYILSRSDNR